MAAARSPCRCFKTRVLPFKVKNTALKDKKWKEKVQKNSKLSFAEEGKLFIKKSSFEEFNHVFSKEKLQNVPRFEMDFELNFAMWAQLVLLA